MQHTIEIGGMTCGHCQGAVRAALASLDGVTVEAVRIGQARVTFDESSVTPEAIAEAVRDAGYDVLGTR